MAHKHITFMTINQSFDQTLSVLSNRIILSFNYNFLHVFTRHRLFGLPAFDAIIFHRGYLN